MGAGAIGSIMVSISSFSIATSATIAAVTLLLPLLISLCPLHFTGAGDRPAMGRSPGCQRSTEDVGASMRLTSCSGWKWVGDREPLAHILTLMN